MAWASALKESQTLPEMHRLVPQNMFDLLRLLAAATVVYAHSLRILGIGSDPTLLLFPRDDLSSFGVMVFFSASGYLVARAAARTPDLKSFARNRALRIFPGLAVCLLVIVLVMGGVATDLAKPDYYGNWLTYKYFLNIFLFPLQTQLPGVFLHNPQPDNVNGSLWSLSSEISAYFLIALIFVFRRKAKILLTASAALLILHYLVSKIYGIYPLIYYPIGYGTEGNYFFLIYFHKVEASRLIAMFIIAASLNYAVPSLFRRRYVLAGCVLLALTGHTPLYEPLAIFLLPYATVTFGRRPFRFSNLLRQFDLSYGIYLYHFPIMQLTWSLTHGFLTTPLQVLCGIALTLAVATASWMLVERPALRFKNGRGTVRGNPSLSPSKVAPAEHLP